MTRDQIIQNILKIMHDEFEMENPGLDDDLRESHGFDSIDAITLLELIEDMLNSQLTQDEKKSAMEIRTINQICDYIERLIKART
jgi:acyl carrier protein